MKESVGRFIRAGICIVPLFIATVGCGGGLGTPAGYRIRSVLKTNGSTSGIAATIDFEIVLPYNGATGTTRKWTAKTGWPTYRADSPADVILPGEWAGSWRSASPCTGQVAIGEFQRGMIKDAVCEINTFSSISPSRIDDTTQPDTMVTMAGQGFDTTYGMPRVFFFDEFGEPAGETTASGVAPDGTWIQGTRSSLDGLESGTYTAVAYNVTAGEDLVFVSVAQVVVVRSEPPRIPCGFSTLEDYEAAQQCTGGATWDENRCQCTCNPDPTIPGLVCSPEALLRRATPFIRPDSCALMAQQPRLPTNRVNGTSPSYP